MKQNTKSNKISFDESETQFSTPTINMIPLIDVMLVLLVIFMMTASVALMPIPLNLPSQSSPQSQSLQSLLPKLQISIPEESQKLNLNLNTEDLSKNSSENSSKNTTIYINQKPIKLSDLKSVLQQFKEENLSKISTMQNQKAYQIEIYADQKSYYGVLSNVLATLQEEGLTNIEFILKST